MIYRIICLVALATFLPASYAEEAPPPKETIVAPKYSIWANYYLHAEAREDVPGTRVRYNNSEFSLGFDYLIDANNYLFVGGRGGLYQEQVLTGVPVGPRTLRPFLGAQLFKLFYAKQGIAFKLGAVSDFMIVPNGPSAPVWLFVGAVGGVRVSVTDSVYFELPAELGFCPFFDGTPTFLKIGVQVGTSI